MSLHASARDKMASHGNPQGREFYYSHENRSRAINPSKTGRPYSKRRGGGRAWGRHNSSGSSVVGLHPSYTSGSQPREKRSKVETTDSSKVVEPSANVLARVAAIRKSGERYLEQMSGSESDEEEEDLEYTQLLRNTLKMYYQDLNTAASNDGEWSTLHAKMLDPTPYPPT